MGTIVSDCFSKMILNPVQKGVFFYLFVLFITMALKIFLISFFVGDNRANRLSYVVLSGIVGD